MRRRALGSAAAAATVLLVLCASARAAGPTVVPPDQKAYGMTYGEWHAAGWKAYLEIPVSEHPALGNGSLCGFHDGVLHPYIHGSGEVTCTIGPNTPILKPVAVNVCLNATPSIYPPVELRPCAVGIFEQPYRPDEISLSIDGVPVADLRSFGAVSPPFHLDLPEDNILTSWGDRAGPREAEAVAAGWLVIIRPLSIGRHVLRNCVTDANKRFWGPEFGGCHTVNVIVAR